MNRTHSDPQGGTEGETDAASAGVRRSAPPHGIMFTRVNTAGRVNPRGKAQESLPLPFRLPLSNGTVIVVEKTPQIGAANFWQMRLMKGENYQLIFVKDFSLTGAIGTLLNKPNYSRAVAIVAEFITAKLPDQKGEL